MCQHFKIKIIHGTPPDEYGGEYHHAASWGLLAVFLLAGTTMVSMRGLAALRAIKRQVIYSGCASPALAGVWYDFS